ncbi:MAG: hypothetical protein IJI03_12150 [Rudaea sp.]|uniref:hypothetical protein n=1 Tax=Rudaea sp. 3F27F6 TaxID=2502208 RepID=UPI001485A877|nr:hypothetical protein [Rudaea sp. 3F27F6]MBR0345998.1 hypothetical protein [Rudaea sp.]
MENRLTRFFENLRKPEVKEEGEIRPFDYALAQVVAGGQCNPGGGGGGGGDGGG